MVGKNSKARAKSSALCINDFLPYHVLVEVLIRIPSVDVFRCRSVCKLWWYALDIDSHFTRRFILEKSKQQEAKQQINAEWNPSEMVVLTPATYCYTASQFTLDFLPFFEDRDPYLESLSYVVIGSSNGLLLCSGHMDSVATYYICNPITWDCLELPPFPAILDHHDVHEGFVSDPFYSINDDGSSVTLNDWFGVKVVRLDFSRYNEDENAREIEVETFRSHTGIWTTSTAHLPDHVNEKLDEGPTTLDNGKMYWVLEEGLEFLVYDMNKNKFDKEPLNLPSNAMRYSQDVDSSVVNFRRLSRCRGSLWAVQASCSKLRVFSLTNDGEWCLEHDVDILDDLECSSSRVKECSSFMFTDGIDFFTMHCDNPVVAYLSIQGMLLECNFGSRTLRVIIELDADDDWLNLHRFFALPVSIPALWPTPLPFLADA